MSVSGQPFGGRRRPWSRPWWQITGRLAFATGSSGCHNEVMICRSQALFLRLCAAMRLLALLILFACTPALPALAAKSSDQEFNMLLFQAQVLKTHRMNVAALPLYQKLVKMRPKSSAAHAGLGWVLWELQQGPQAMDEEIEALRLDPYNADAHHHLASMYFMTGMVPQAVDEYRAAIFLDPRKDCHCGPIFALFLQVPPGAGGVPPYALEAPSSLAAVQKPAARAAGKSGAGKKEAGQPAPRAIPAASPAAGRAQTGQAKTGSPAPFTLSKDGRPDKAALTAGGPAHRSRDDKQESAVPAAGAEPAGDRAGVNQTGSALPAALSSGAAEPLAPAAETASHPDQPGGQGASAGK